MRHQGPRFNKVGVRLGGVALVAMSLTACGAPGGPVADDGDTVFSYASRPRVELLADRAPVQNVVMHDLEGTTWTTDDLKGKVVLVNFWATWCGPCRQEIPDLIKLQDTYGDHLQVIGVSLDEGGTAPVTAFAAELGMNYPVVMATPEILAQFDHVFALPTTFVLDVTGAIAQHHVGLINPAVLEQETRVLASLPTEATVDLVEKPAHTRLADAAHATEIPGIDLSALSPTQKEHALQRLNEDHCTCGCALTLAQCRINDPACEISLPLARQLVDAIATGN